MFKIDISTLTALGSFLIGVGSTSMGVLKWYRETQRKQFAAEREFNHLKRGNEQLKQQVVELDQKVDELTAATVELRGAVSVLLERQGSQPIKMPTLNNLESSHT